MVGLKRIPLAVLRVIFILKQVNRLLPRGFQADLENTGGKDYSLLHNTEATGIL